MRYVDYEVDPTTDSHRSNPKVHYRLYDHPKRGPTVICVQNFDYCDYDAGRIMTPDAYDTEEEAQEVIDSVMRMSRQFLARLFTE